VRGVAAVALALANPLLARHIALAHRKRQHRITTQFAMVVEVFIAESDSIDSLRHQLVHVMFDARSIAVIDEASRHSRRHPDALVHLAKQHAAGVGADAPTIEASGDQTSSQGVKLKLVASTLCLQGCFLHVWPKRLIAQPLCHRKQPFSTPFVSFSG